MNKIFVIVLLSLCSFGTAKSQDAEFFFSAGYNFSKPNLDGLNFVTKRYNETRTILTKNMEEFDMLKGFSITAGVELNKIAMFDLTYIQKVGDTYAEGVVNDTSFQRDLRVSLNSINIGGGVIVFANKSFKTIVGTSVDIGSVGTQTRVYPKNEAKPSYESTEDFVLNPTSNTLFGLTPFLQFNINPGLSNLDIVLKPYYQFMINEADFRDANRVLNPATFAGDEPEEMISRPNNYGIELKVSFNFGK